MERYAFLKERKVIKTVIALEKNMYFINFNRRMDESQSYGNRTEDKTFDLLV